MFLYRILMLTLMIFLSFSLVLFPDTMGLKWGKIDIKLNRDTYYIEQYKEINIPLTIIYLPYFVAYYPIWVEVKIIDKPSWISITNEEACFLLYPKINKTITMTLKITREEIETGTDGKIILMVTGRILTQHLFREIEPAKIEITVKYRFPPVINIVYPQDDAIVKGVIVIRGTVTGKEINKIEIKIDKGNWEIVEGSAYWEYVLDTRKIGNGIHVIKARAFDGYNYSTVSTIHISVKNEDAHANIWPLYLIVPAIFIIITIFIKKMKQTRR